MSIPKMPAGQLTRARGDYSLAEVGQTVCSAMASLAVEKGLTRTASLPADVLQPM